VLLTRSPLIPQQAGIIVRLACVKHAASVHPEPGSNSPLKTKNQTDTTTPTGNNDGTRLHKIRNQLKTSPPHTGVHDRTGINFNQSKNNRYQQTWHTIEFSNNRHTRHHPHPPKGPESLRSNFSNLPEPAAQSKPTPGLPHQPRSAQKHYRNRRFEGSLSPSFRISGGDSDNITRAPPPHQIHPNTTQKPRQHTENNPKTTPNHQNTPQ
jgi:hypothetical protein